MSALISYPQPGCVRKRTCDSADLGFLTKTPQVACTLIISCKNVCVKYDSGFAVNDVSFDINEGDYLCIVGENGSGKTTLMKAMLGLIKINSGKIEYNGLKQTEIGFIPQQTPVQKDFPTSVFEVVLSGCQNSHKWLPFYTGQDKKRAKETLCLLGAEAFVHKSYRDLSGGQQQRVLLARALCATEKVLLLDEPVAGLDPMMSNELYGLLEKLNKQGITVIMISHDISSAVKYAKKILHMNNSSLFFGTTEEYRKSEIGSHMINYCAENGGEHNA